MIWVDRYREEDGKVIKPSDNWFERAKRQTDKAVEEGANHNVTDSYKDAEVKMALEKLFYDKCAYCETRNTTAGSWDVEHYRPKGRVAERPNDHPGYYWLAYKWKNLYPSCKFCNQKRKDQPRYDDRRKLPAQGKLDQFPIKNERDRAMKPGDDLSRERPFLLDPNNDDPESHLTYDIHGQTYPIDENDRRASETIRICHLTRRRLRDDRARIINRVRKCIRNIRLAKQQNNLLAERMLTQTLEDFKAPNEVYIGAARAVIRDPDAFISE